MSFMDILKAGVIHEHVWKLFDELKVEGGGLPKKEMHEAHKYYEQNAEEYELPIGEDNFFEGELFDLPLPTKQKMRIKDGKTKTTYMPSLTESWFSGKNITDGDIRKQLNRITNKANIALDKINKKNAEKQEELDDLIESTKPKKGEKISLDMDAYLELNNKMENLEAQIENMEIVTKVIVRLKQAVQMPEQKGETTEQSNLVEKLLRLWGKGGYGADSKRVIDDLDKIGFFKSKKMDAIQQMLLYGDKKNIPRNIWESFIPRNIRFDKENKEWADYIKYHKRESKDIFFEIINRLGISTVLPKQRTAATKKIKEYYGTDLLSNIEKIKETMKSKKIEDYQYLFNVDMIETNRNVIYKLSNHIMDTYEDAREIKDKLDDSEIEEKTNEINELINVLEFLYQVMDITANLDIIDDRELTEVIELNGKLSGRTVTIKFDTTKKFPKLQKAFDNAEDIASTQEEKHKKKLSARKQTKKYKSKQEKFQNFIEEVKEHFKGTKTGYKMEIEELNEQLKSDEKLSPQKKVGIRHAINNRKKSIEELEDLNNKYQQRGPINIVMTSKNIIKDLRQLIQSYKEMSREEEEEKVQAQLKGKVEEIEEMISSFQQLKEKTPDTDNQQEVEGDE